MRDRKFVAVRKEYALPTVDDDDCDMFDALNFMLRNQLTWILDTIIIQLSPVVLSSLVPYLDFRRSIQRTE